MIIHAIEGYVNDGDYNNMSWTVKAFTSYELAEQFFKTMYRICRRCNRK